MFPVKKVRPERSLAIHNKYPSNTLVLSFYLLYGKLCLSLLAAIKILYVPATPYENILAYLKSVFKVAYMNLLASCTSAGDGFELNISLSRYAH